MPDKPAGTYSSRRGRMKSEHSPFTILWEITNRCNLECVYCHADIRARQKEGVRDIPFGRLLVVADKLIDARVFEVILTGGEPFLRRKDTLRLMAYLKRHSVHVGVISNGMLIDRNLAGALKSLDVSVAISLDASTEDIQRQTRGAGVHSRALEAIAMLVESGVRANAVCTLTRINYGDLENFLELLRGMSVKSVAIQNLAPFENVGAYHRLKLTREQEAALPQKIMGIKKTFPDMCINFTEVDTFARHEMVELNDRNRDNRLMGGCSACQRGAFIDAKGIMYPCASMRMLPMGSVLDSDVHSLWTKSRSSRFVRDMLAKTTDSMPQCGACRWKDHCSAGCRGQAYTLYGAWDALHDRCPMRYDPEGMKGAAV